MFGVPPPEIAGHLILLLRHRSSDMNNDSTNAKVEVAKNIQRQRQS